MFQCCWYDRLSATQKTVKTYISNLTKIDKDVLLLFTGKSAAERPGAQPKRDSESALAAGRARGEDRYFHEGHHNLSGLGPGFMIVMLGLAAADGPGAASGPVPAGCCGPASGSCIFFCPANLAFCPPKCTFCPDPLLFCPDPLFFWTNFLRSDRSVLLEQPAVSHGQEIANIICGEICGKKRGGLGKKGGGLGKKCILWAKS